MAPLLVSIGAVAAVRPDFGGTREGRCVELASRRSFSRRKSRSEVRCERVMGRGDSTKFGPVDALASSNFGAGSPFSPGIGFVSTPCWAYAITFCQVIAGREPPVIFRVGV